MIRRQTRLRREYLYRKSLENKEKQIYERKQKIKEAIKEGKRIPSELRQEAVKLQKDLNFDEAQTVPSSHIDDEYARAGIYDPKVLITTSRDPSSRLAQFAKEMRLIIPNSQRINRGNYVIKDMVDACRANEVTDLIILHEHRGEPDGMVICHFPYGPTAYFSLHNVVLRHDIQDEGTVSQVTNILKYLFPVPKDDSKRVLTFANESDYISFRHHVYVKINNKEIQLAEVGPRFEMRIYEIKLGTVDLKAADTEWVLRPYHRTAKKRDHLYVRKDRSDSGCIKARLSVRYVN
ncbi:4975_t:CDS:10 [Cetraspora pellucida]|uniref:U3 small nucleolar ribonucleoprotein protein IMP4 n=1 Tax=Cetraspora pellucida TaxID=1433469 RepID=A0A9N8VWT7_9GLOM|nr:4975_t:CDS:10 [Cetraspora pellucida]